MRQVTTELEIGAPAELIWSMLMDFPSYPEWNPFIRSISGVPKAGAHLNVEIQLPGRSPSRFTPKVLRVLNKRELRWKGRLLIPGIFDGEHWFMLYPLSPESTRMVQGETFSGILAPVILAMIKQRTKDGFRTMNEALKLRAERAYADSSTIR